MFNSHWQAKRQHQNIVKYVTATICSEICSNTGTVDFLLVLDILKDVLNYLQMYLLHFWKFYITLEFDHVCKHNIFSLDQNRSQIMFIQNFIQIGHNYAVIEAITRALQHIETTKLNTDLPEYDQWPACRHQDLCSQHSIQHSSGAGVGIRQISWASDLVWFRTVWPEHIGLHHR